MTFTASPLSFLLLCGGESQKEDLLRGYLRRKKKTKDKDERKKNFAKRKRPVKCHFSSSFYYTSTGKAAVTPCPHTKGGRMGKGRRGGSRNHFVSKWLFPPFLLFCLSLNRRGGRTVITFITPLFPLHFSFLLSCVRNLSVVRVRRNGEEQRKQRLARKRGSE